MHIEKKTLRNILLCAGGVFVLYLLLSGSDKIKSVFIFFRDLLFPFFLGGALAFILNVPVRGYERMLVGVKKKSGRRLLAIALTLLTFALILAVIFVLLIPQLSKAFQDLGPSVAGFLKQSETFIMGIKPDWSGWGDLSDVENIQWTSLFKNFFSIFGDNVQNVLGSAFSAIGDFAGTVIDLLIAFVFAIYCVLQKENLARQFRKLAYAYLPEKLADGIVRVMRLTNSIFSNFLSGQCLEVCILGCMFAVTMTIFRLPFVPLISILIAVTAFIPVVGAWIGCIVGAFLILMVSPVKALWFVVVFAILQWIENNFIYPKVVGTSIGLPGMWVLVAVAIGGDLMGVTGMFLMIPAASVLYTLLRDTTEKRLSERNVDPEKLKDHAPDLKPGLSLMSVFRFKKKKTEKTQNSEKEEIKK